MFVKRNSVFFFRISGDSRQFTEFGQREGAFFLDFRSGHPAITDNRVSISGVREISDRVIGQLVEGCSRFAKAIINYHLLSQLLPGSFEKLQIFFLECSEYFVLSPGHSIRWRDYNPFCTQFYFTAWAHFPSWRVI